SGDPWLQIPFKLHFPDLFSPLNSTCIKCKDTDPEINPYTVEGQTASLEKASVSHDDREQETKRLDARCSFRATPHPSLRPDVVLFKSQRSKYDALLPDKRDIN
ncbi:hypothetical protein F2P81_013075, partial [Scophthalmus maximus]